MLTTRNLLCPAILVVIVGVTLVAGCRKEAAPAVNPAQADSAVGDKTLETMAVLGKMPTLESLQADDSKVDDDGFGQLGALLNLKYLNVANTSIGFNVIDELAESNEDLEVGEFEN